LVEGVGGEREVWDVGGGKKEVGSFGVQSSARRDSTQSAS